MPPRGRPRGFDRTHALRRAMEVFWEHGYDGTSVSDLTSAMGITAPSLYAAFDGKEALFREAVSLYNRIEGGITERALREEPSARDAIEAMLRDNAVAYTAEDKPHGCMIVLAGFTYNAQSQDVRDFLTEQRREMRTDIRQRLERGISDGDLPADCDPATMADFYATVMYGLSVRARDGASIDDLTRVIDSAMAAWPTRSAE